MSNTEKIKQLNDEFRTTLTGGKIILTEGVQSLGEAMVVRLLVLMQSHDDFPEDNDPYGEHDFGAIEFQGRKYFWKIDYYDRDYLMHSPNAADPDITKRVLTLMLAEEY